MTTLENKRNDIITLAKRAEVDTYVPQVHVYNMIHIYVMNREIRTDPGIPPPGYSATPRTRV